MSRKVEKMVPLPGDFAGITALNNQSMQITLKSYNNWLRSAGLIQAELLQFFNKRIREDMEMPARFAECCDAADIVEQQVSFTNTMFKDYADENQKVFNLMSQAARDLELEAETALAEPPQQ